MENAHINREKEEFVPRKNYEEFYRDGEVIEDLFEWTDSLMANEYNIPYGEYTLQVFNHAYHICWMIFHENSSVMQISKSIEFENEVVREFSFKVAYVLCILHEKFHKIDMRIRRVFSYVFYHGSHVHFYRSFVSENELPCPIEFHAPMPDIDLVQTRDDIMAAMNKAVRLDKENKMLRKRMELERTKRAEAELNIKTLQEKLDAWENDTFYKAVNINTILKYAQESGICDNNDIKTIRMMLVDLCANKVPNKVIEKIKTLKFGGTIYIEKQENHGCQNFYGDISDSSFSAKQ